MRCFDAQMLRGQATFGAASIADCLSVRSFILVQGEAAACRARFADIVGLGCVIVRIFAVDFRFLVTFLVKDYNIVGQLTCLLYTSPSPRDRG